jgi:hypothetical protein
MAKQEFPIEIGKADKNKTEVIVVNVSQYKGKKFIDARVNFRDREDPDKLIPTKKGLTLSMKTFEPVMKLLLVAYKQLQELDEKTATEDDSEVSEP